MPLPWCRGHARSPQAGPCRPLPAALPGRRVLRDEVALVLALSLAASALYAIVDILSAPIRGVEAPLFADVGLVYQLLNLATSIVPVPWSSTSSTATASRRPASAWTPPGPGPTCAGGSAWPPWSAPSASASTSWPSASASTAPWSRSPHRPLVDGPGAAARRRPQRPARRGDRLRLPAAPPRPARLVPAKALWASALLRGAYHLYQGFGGFFGNLALGLFFGRLYQLRGRTTPLVIAHFLIDAAAGLGYLALRGHVWWLPG